MMISVEHIKSIINQKLNDENIFLVEITVDKQNRIKVFIDNVEGISIEKCVEISRVIENKLDRDIEDYALEVSSPGIDRPLTMPFQYKKNSGRKIEIITHEGKSVKGILQSADDQKVEVEIKTREPVGNKRKKETVMKKTTLEYSEIKLAKVILTF